MKFFPQLLIIIFFFIGNHSLIAQESDLRKIEGIVFDYSLDNPLIGANIFIQETGIQAVSEFDGEFELSIPKNKNVIITVTYNSVSKYFITEKEKSYYEIDMSRKTQRKLRKKLKKMRK